MKLTLFLIIILSQAPFETDSTTVISETLEEAVVIDKKHLAKREIDRIVFDAAGFSSNSLNLFDLLQTTPGVIVKEDGVEIVGKGSVQVLINGRDSKLTGKELISTMKGYSSTDVDKIEVITNPPAKYDSQGNAGIINIRMKKRIGNYFGGTLSDMQAFSNYNQNDYYASLNYLKNKVSAYLNVAGGFGLHGFEKSYLRHYPEYVLDYQAAQTNDNMYVMPRFGVDVELPKNYAMGVMVGFLYMRPDCIETNQTVALFNQQSSKSINGIMESNIKNNQYDINLHIEKTFNNSKKKVEVDADFLDYATRTGTDYTSDSKFNYSDIERGDVRNYSARTDLYLPFNKVVVNAGIKYSHTNTRRQMTYIYNTMANFANDDFHYNESVGAVYGDADLALSEKFQIKLGLRFEYTHTDGMSLITLETIKKNYINLFPTLYFSYKPSDKHTHSLIMARRLDRPPYSSVNPIAIYENEYCYYIGNPKLNPSYTYSINYGYTFMGNLSFDLTYGFSEKVFGRRMIMDPETQITVYKWMNFKKNHVVMVTNSYIFNKLNWLQTYLQHSLYWTKSIADYDQADYFRNGLSYYLSIFNTFYFNKSKTLIGNLSFTYSSKTYSANEVANGTYYLNAGLQYSLLKNRITLALSADNILSSHFRGTTYDNNLFTRYDNNLFTRYDNTYNYRRYRISLSWRFGGTAYSKIRSAGNTEEKNRL